MRSLRTRLLLSLTAVVLTAWVTTAVFSYLDARDRIGAMLDEHLVQAAHLIVGLSGQGDAPTRPPPHWGAEEEGHSLVYQVWSGDGRLLFRSADAPLTPLSETAEGHSVVDRAGASWRVFGMRENGLHVLVSEHATFRNELAASVAEHLLHPVWVALPLLAMSIWLSVRWALAPLRGLTNEVARRQPDDLAPLGERSAPAEVRPLVTALDALFGRVGDLVESERRFTADAAHELRTPLAAIRTNAEVALAARDDAERRQALLHVTEGTERATRLVAQLLMLAKLDARAAAVPEAPVSLKDLCTRQVTEAAPFAASKGVSLGLSAADDELAPVRGDPDLLGVLIRNLVDNAIRYSPAGGSVDVSVERRRGFALLAVRDVGPGIPLADRARILERFYRGRGSSEQGSGLGLSIAARIAELHGAKLVLGEGADGRGLAVQLGLPLA